MSRTKGKRAFEACADSEGPDQSDQSLRCPLTESFDTDECISGVQRPGWDFAHAQDGLCLCILGFFLLDVAHMMIEAII